MSEIWRVIDTGLRNAAQNIAISRSLLEARQAGEVPSTLRFLRYTPCALLSSGQSAAQELNLDYCGPRKIPLQRRITGGSADYCDATQLEWELCLHQSNLDCTDRHLFARRVCHAAATAISALGIDARFRPRGDIEVDGRRIMSGGGAFDGDALLYRGSLMIDTDVGEMLRVLRLPVERFSDTGIASARKRVASLQDLLGYRANPEMLKHYLTEVFENEFNVEFRESDLTLAEHARYHAALAEIDTPDWVDLDNRPASDAPMYEAAHKYPKGTLNVRLIYDKPMHRIRQVWFGGDIAIVPPRTLADLEATLHDSSVERLDHNVRVFFAARRVDMPWLTTDDLIAVTRLAVRQPLVLHRRE